MQDPSPAPNGGDDGAVQNHPTTISTTTTNTIPTPTRRRTTSTTRARVSPTYENIITSIVLSPSPRINSENELVPLQPVQAIKRAAPFLHPSVRPERPAKVRRDRQIVYEGESEEESDCNDDRSDISSKRPSCYEKSDFEEVYSRRTK